MNINKSNKILNLDEWKFLIEKIYPAYFIKPVKNHTLDFNTKLKLIFLTVFFVSVGFPIYFYTSKLTFIFLGNAFYF